VSELRRSVRSVEPTGTPRRAPAAARADEPALLRLQRAAGNRAAALLVQRNIFWQEVGGNPSSALPTAAAPQRPYWERAGNSQNNQLHPDAPAARGAAKSALNLSGDELSRSFTKRLNNTPADSGNYTFFPSDGSTKVLVNHDGDVNAQLTRVAPNGQGQPRQPINHFHAGIYSQPLTKTMPDASLLAAIYARPSNAAEHYFVKPSP
jgi:hypothetical protein